MDFFDRPNCYSIITVRSRDQRVSSAESSTEALLRRARSSAARDSQVTQTEMAAQMAIIRVPDLCNNEPVIVMQKTTNLPMTDQHAADYRN